MKPRIAVVGALVALAACEGQLTQPPTPEPSVSMHGAADALSAQSEFDAPPAYTISANLAGGAVLGQPIPMQVTVHSRIGAASVAVEVHAPEVVLGHATHWNAQAFKIPVMEHINPILRFVSGMSLNASTAHRIQIDASKPGIYQVIIVARANDLPEIVRHGGRAYQNVGVTSSWLVVTDTGIYMTGKPRASDYPRGALPTAGPFRSYSSVPLDDHRPQHGPAATDIDSQTYRTVYYDWEAYNFIPMGNIFVNLRRRTPTRM